MYILGSIMIIPLYWLVYRDSPFLDYYNPQQKLGKYNPPTNHQPGVSQPGGASSQRHKVRPSHFNGPNGGDEPNGDGQGSWLWW